MSGRDDPDFLARWSRRKRDAAKDEDADEAAARAPVGDGPVPAAAAAEEKSDAEILEELGLPDPDTLGPGADFTAFMAKAVPQRLRNRALRRLWLSNPALANLDELLEYGEDFTAPSVVEAVQTAYQVGKGYLLADDEEAGEAAAGEPPEDAPQEAETAGAVESTSADPAADGEHAEATVADAPESAPAEPGAEPLPPPDKAPGPLPRRRMRFHVAES